MRRDCADAAEISLPIVLYNGTEEHDSMILPCCNLKYNKIVF